MSVNGGRKVEVTLGAVEVVVCVLGEMGKSKRM